MPADGNVRAVIDTNVEIATRPKFKDILARSNANPELMQTQVRLLAEIVDPPPLLEPVSRDPDDDAVLAAAARPDLIIAGDKDLLVLGAHAGIPIVSAAEALARITPRLCSDSNVKLVLRGDTQAPGMAAA